MTGARSVSVALGVAVVVLAMAGEGAGQTPEARDDRWLPWIGCWEAAPGEAGPIRCVVQRDGGVEMMHVAGDRVVERRWLVADGAERTTESEGCRIRESARFSADSRRVFVRAERRCDGGGEERITGILAMVSTTEWSEVQALESADGHFTWAHRFVPAAPERAGELGLTEVEERAEAIRLARVRAAVPPGVDEVIEAFRWVGDGAVQGWVAERGAPMTLDAARLVRLAEAGVAPETIDVVVAVSNPGRLVVARVGPGGGAPGIARTASAARSPSFDGHFSPWTSWGFGSWYRYGYGYGSVFLPMGYGPAWGWGWPLYRLPPTVIVVERAEPRGRVVNREGYTRSRAPGTGTPGGPPVRRDDGGSGSPPRGSDPGRGGGASSGGPGVSPEGTSGGGSSTGRRAVPRGGG